MKSIRCCGPEVGPVPGGLPGSGGLESNKSRSLKSKTQCHHEKDISRPPVPSHSTLLMALSKTLSKVEGSKIEGLVAGLA